MRRFDTRHFKSDSEPETKPAAGSLRLYSESESLEESSSSEVEARNHRVSAEIYTHEQPLLYTNNAELTIQPENSK